MWSQLLLFFAMPLFMGCLFVPLCLTLAHRLHILDIPDNQLKRHARPVAYLGGVAVFFAWSVSLLCLSSQENWAQVLPLLVGLAALLIVGLLDDLFRLSPVVKFFGQLFSVLIFVWLEWHVKSSFLGSCAPGACWWWLLISAFWMMTIINGVNLIDVMDGLSSLAVWIASLLFSILAFCMGDVSMSYLCIALCGALIPFMWVNFPPARMYLGDAGALWLGGFLAIVSCALHWAQHSVYGAIAALFVLWVPLAELGSLILVRLYKGMWPWRGSPDHFSLVLLGRGWSKKQVLGFVCVGALLQGPCAYWAWQGTISCLMALFMIGMAASLWILLLYVLRNK